MMVTGNLVQGLNLVPCVNFFQWLLRACVYVLVCSVIDFNLSWVISRLEVKESCSWYFFNLCVAVSYFIFNFLFLAMRFQVLISNTKNCKQLLSFKYSLQIEIIFGLLDGFRAFLRLDNCHTNIKVISSLTLLPCQLG